MVSMSIKNGVVLFLVILLIGCDSTDVFVPDAIVNVEESKTATIETDSAHRNSILKGLDQRLYISSVNGQRTVGRLSLRSYPDISKIPLGRNIIGLYYIHGRIYRNGCVTFIAEKGETYTAHKKVGTFKIDYWVTDNATKKVVGRPCSKNESSESVLKGD